MLQSHLQPWQPEFCLENEIVWVFRKTWPAVYSYDWGNRQRPLKHWHNLNWLNLPSIQIEEYYWGSQHAIPPSMKAKSTLLYFCYGNSTKERREMKINMKCYSFLQLKHQDYLERHEVWEWCWCNQKPHNCSYHCPVLRPREWGVKLVAR